MNALFLDNPIQAQNRLEQLGLSKPLLLEAIRAMVAARNNCTENDPPSAPGWSSWRDGTRRLREVLIPLGWKKDDTDMISSAFNEKLGIKVSVQNADASTGVENQTPQNSSQKGAATERIVEANGDQFEFRSILDQMPGVIPISSETRASTSGITHWYLCVFCEGDTYRAELSCPVQCVGGFFTKYSERIPIIDDQPDDGAKLRRDVPDDGGEFEIPVIRKAAS